MRKLSLLIAMVLGITSLAAQEFTPNVVNTNDFRGRIEGAFEWEVVDDLSVEASVQMRLNNDLSSIDRFQTGIAQVWVVTALSIVKNAQSIATRNL